MIDTLFPESETLWLLSLLGIFIVTTLSVNALYMTVFHPFAKYPGPWIARFTNLRAAYHGLKGDLHIDMTACHNRYGRMVGEYVRYGPNKLLVNSPQALHDIYGHNKNVKKSTAYLPLVPERRGWSTLTSIDKVLHRSKRRLLSRGLSDAAMKSFEPRIIRHLKIFETHLRADNDAAWSSAKDMNVLCKWLTLDIMAEFAFGESTQLLEKEDNRFLVDCINIYLWRMGCYYEHQLLENFDCMLLAYLWAQGKYELVQQFAAWKQSFGAQVLARGGGTKEGLFSLVLDAGKEDEQHYTNDEIWAEGIFLMLAGSDTSTTAISALFFYLSRYPHVYRKLATEIRTLFSTATEIRISHLAPCQYLWACITETLRMAPSTPAAPWREVEEGGAFVAESFIPSKCNVGTSIYAIHHRSDIFKQPFEFIPERWTSTEPEQLNYLYKAYNPFSLGPRGCAGRSMAFAEVGLLTVRVMLLYDFRVADSDLGNLGAGGEKLQAGRQNPAEYQIESHVTALSQGPVLQFKRRVREG